MREVRHRAEVPLLVLYAAVTAAGVTAGIVLAINGHALPEWALVAFAGLGVPPIAAAVVIRWTYWRRIANSVEVTPRQLPELYAIHADLVTAMGLDHTPRLYVTNGNGLLNASASKCQIRRGYVVVFSDLIDVGYEHGDWATVRFVLAHELAHIRCGHVALWRTAITGLPSLIRLDRSLTRAQEYTADRCAARYAPDGAAGLMVLYAGKRLYRRIDLAAYHASISEHRDGVWLRLVNLLSTHPVGIRRMQTIAAMQQRGWDVHGRML